MSNFSVLLSIKVCFFIGLYFLIPVKFELLNYLSLKIIELFNAGVAYLLIWKAAV